MLEEGGSKTSINIGSKVVPVSATAELNGLALKTRQYLAAAKADNTRRAYRADWEDFESWCHQHGLDPLPAAVETVALCIRPGRQP